MESRLFLNRESIFSLFRTCRHSITPAVTQLVKVVFILCLQIFISCNSIQSSMRSVAGHIVSIPDSCIIVYGNYAASMTLDLDSIDSDYLTLVVIPNMLIPHIDVLFLERDWTRQQYRIVGKGWEDCMIQHHLSYDEWQCLYLSARGDSIKSIADHLGISESKVKHLRNKGYEILGVNTIVQATEIISFFRLRPLYSLL